MALTQVKTLGIADDAITSDKIADDAVLVAAIADNAVQTAQINAGAVTGNEIADDTVTESKMANDAISLTELKGGTDGQIISWDANGDPVAIGPGTDGQVLTSTGAGSPPAFEDAVSEGTQVKSTGESGGTKFLREDGDGTSSWQAVPAGGVDGISSSANATAITIDSDERVMIGTSSAQNADSMLTIAETSGHCEVNILAKNDSGAVLNFGDPEDYNIGRMKYDHSANEFIWDVNNTHRLSLESGGDLNIEDGNLKVAAGHGIDFSAQGDDATNMSSELFDDYEEGWFEPACTNSITWDAYNDRLYYRKVGNTCTIGGRLIVDNGQNGGVLNLSGLPFAHADHSDGTDRTLDHFFFHDWTNLHSNWDDSKCAFYQIHSTNMNLYIRNSSGDWTYFHPYDDGIISFNITYPTT